MAHIHVTEEYEQEAEKFYQQFLKDLVESSVPFLIGGTYAVRYYTQIKRPTKDIDVFCKHSDYPRLLKALKDEEYDIEIVDDRWLAKANNGQFFADIIFGSIPLSWPIDDYWIKHAPETELLGQKVRVTPAEELIVSKMYRQGRNNFDGADVIHIILKQGPNLDWKRILNRVEPNWEVLFSHLIMFRFVYPSDRENIPKWLMDELVERLQLSLEMPQPQEKICKGSLLSHTQYQTAYTDWGYKDMTDFFYKGEYYADPGK